MTRNTPPPTSRRERRAQARQDRPGQRSRVTRQPAARPAWQSPMVLITGGAILIGLIVIFFATRPADPGDELYVPPSPYQADLVDGTKLGSKTAPVVMELYSDFQCPACKVLVTQQLARLYADFVQPGTLRIEAVDIDIVGRGDQNESIELAVGGECAAEQGRYWPYHDIVFWNQGGENLGAHSRAWIGRVATAANLDQAKFDTCFAREDLRRAVREHTTAALALGVGSTPTLRLNGELVVGVQQYEQLAAKIQQLAAAASPAPSAVPTAAPS